MKECQPLVSVGIPTYNRPEGLRRTLECITGQTYKNLEIIVSDNCSPNLDVTNVINEFVSREKKIKYYRQVENKGACFNFDFVLKKATGEYFMWIGDDDWLDANYIEACMNVLLYNNDYSLIAGKTKYYFGKNYVYERNKFSIIYKSPFKRLMKYYSKVTDNGIFYGIYRKKLLENINIRNCLGWDWFLVSKIAFSGNILMLDKTSTNRIVTGTGDTLYYENLVNSIRINRFKKLHIVYPHFFIAINASKEIIKDSFYRNQMVLSKRIICAIVIFLILLFRWVLPKIILQCKVFFKLFSKRLAHV